VLAIDHQLEQVETNDRVYEEKLNAAMVADLVTCKKELDYLKNL